MAQIEENDLVDTCDEIIFMLDNGHFYYESSEAYSCLIVKLFKDYIQHIESYNRQEENPERFFDNYTQEEQIALDIFGKLLAENNELINIDLSNQNDIALLEKYFTEITRALSNYTANNNLPAIVDSTAVVGTVLPPSAYANNNEQSIMKANEKQLNNLAVIAQQEQQIANAQAFLHSKNISIENEVFQSHQMTVNLLANYNFKVWKEQNNKLFYRLKPYAQKQKATKMEISDTIFKITGIYVPIYESVDDVNVKNDYCLIVSFLPAVRKEIFNIWSSDEFTVIANNMYDKNTFEYTDLLKKRLFPTRINQLEYEINNLRAQLYYTQPYYQQISNQIIAKEDEIKQLRESLFFKDKSFIEEFLKLIFYNENEFNFIISWLCNYFWTLRQSNIAVVLIGDSETTDILVDNIIKPLFIINKKNMSIINNDTLAKNDNEKLLDEKIFYQVKNITVKTNGKQVASLLRNIVKANTITPIEAWDNDESYIYGELLISSEKENPYPYLKNILSSCTVLRVKNMSCILDKFDMDYSEFDKNIANDLDNFVNKLVEYSQHNTFPMVLNTDEKSYLHTMKNGVLITPIIDNKINSFVVNILSKNKNAFEIIKKYDEQIHEEFLSNLEEGMIAQPLLSTYFNIINDDILIPDNAEFVKILQTKADMFQEVPTDKSKAYGKKRYKIF